MYYCHDVAFGRNEINKYVQVVELLLLLVHGKICIIFNIFFFFAHSRSLVINENGRKPWLLLIIDSEKFTFSYYAFLCRLRTK